MQGSRLMMKKYDVYVEEISVSYGNICRIQNYLQTGTQKAVGAYFLNV